MNQFCFFYIKKEDNNEDNMNDQEIEALVTNVVQAIKAKESNDEDQPDSQFDKKLSETLKLKNMNLLEALTNLKNSSIYQVAAAAAAASAASSSNQHSQNFNKASFHNYLQSTIPLANVRGATDPRLANNNFDFQNISISYDNRLDTNMYQTIENSLYMNMCMQNETILKSISEPLPASSSNSYSENQNSKLNCVSEVKQMNGHSSDDGESNQAMNAEKTGK